MGHVDLPTVVNAAQIVLPYDPNSAPPAATETSQGGLPLAGMITAVVAVAVILILIITKRPRRH